MQYHKKNTKICVVQYYKVNVGGDVCLGTLAVAVRRAAKSLYVPVSIDQWTQSLSDLQYQLKMF